MQTAYIGIGGNLGDVRETFRRAYQLLGGHQRVSSLRASQIFRTTPVGQNAGSDYLNAAVEIVTSLDPFELLDLLIEIEQHLHRKRHLHWGPRTIDLDLVFYGEKQIQEARLNVPHPAAWYRRFVLDPVADLNPNVVHPTKGMTVAELKKQLSRRPLRLLLLGSDERIGTNLREHLTEEFAGQVDVSWRSIEQPFSDDAYELIAWNIEQKLRLGENAVRFEDLPNAFRLDVSLLSGDAYTSVSDVIKAATDEPVADGQLT